jgi:hypothetical protein
LIEESLIFLCPTSEIGIQPSTNPIQNHQSSSSYCTEKDKRANRDARPC